MEIKRVKIMTRDGYVYLPGLVDDGWAIVPYKDKYRGWVKHRFNVTHLKTGAAVGGLYLEKSEAIEVMAKFKSIKWRNIPLGDLPACEIVTHAESINEMLEQYGREIYKGTLKEVKNRHKC